MAFILLTASIILSLMVGGAIGIIFVPIKKSNMKLLSGGFIVAGKVSLRFGSFRFYSKVSRRLYDLTGLLEEIKDEP